MERFSPLFSRGADSLIWVLFSKNKPDNLQMAYDLEENFDVDKYFDKLYGNNGPCSKYMLDSDTLIKKFCKFLRII